MVSAMLALVGLLLSLYLFFWKVGLLGPLACGEGTCEQVQLSPYGQIGGIPVAAFGVVGYLAILAVSLAGLQGANVDRRWPTDALLAFSLGGVAFTAYLTYLEAFVIHAWCRWCLGSAAIIGAVCCTAVVGWVRWGKVGSVERGALPSR
jgi:uncharacterized membrane protein